MSIKFDYYYGKEAESFSFFRIPKLLFTDPIFTKLSSDAKVLYGILLDRMSLSMKNKWMDEANKVYNKDYEYSFINIQKQGDVSYELFDRQ